MTLKLETLVLATHNTGKINEFTHALSFYVPNIITAAELNLPEPEETGTSFLENAMLKATLAAKACGKPVLADDSGLAVEALNGAPGIYSARWAGESKDFNAAMAKINAELGENPNRKAAFIAVLVIGMPDGQFFHAEGRVEGNLCWPPRGTGGFGYDPMFIPADETRSFGEMSMAEKAKYSHRMKALTLLKEHFV
jgi:XTP/dITP diphosphohydrolase